MPRADLDRVAATAARLLGLPDPVHLRSGGRTVFVTGDDAVLRVGGTPDEVALARTTAERLARAGVRTPRPLADPVIVEGWCVVAVERLHPTGTVDWAAVGETVRRIHSLEPWDGLPHCTSFRHWQFDALLDDLAPLVDTSSAAALRRCLERRSGWVAEVGAAPSVLLHGDVHPGNVVPTDAGPVLLDWDQCCSGPAAWDHAPLMTWTERWGGEPGLYERFADGYGRSFRDDGLGEALGELRLLAATLMRIAAGQQDVAARAEADLRLQWWRNPDGAPRWTAQ